MPFGYSSSSGVFRILLRGLILGHSVQGRARREAQMENAAVALTSDPADISDEVRFVL